MSTITEIYQDTHTSSSLSLLETLSLEVKDNRLVANTPHGRRNVLLTSLNTKRAIAYKYGELYNYFPLLPEHITSSVDTFIKQYELRHKQKQWESPKVRR